VASSGIVEQIVLFDAVPFLTGHWLHFMTLHNSGFVILDHPDYDPGGATLLIYDPAILDTSTAAYIEVERILNTTQTLHIDGAKNCFKVMFLLGDQQTFDRMNVLISWKPQQYSWAIPMNGDFHFAAHTVMCNHDLYFLPFSSWVVTKMGMVKETDDNIANFKQYDHFYLLLTLAIVTLLNSVFDMAQLNFPESIAEFVRENQGEFCYICVAFSLTSP
jgi:hypothetical protein